MGVPVFFADENCVVWVQPAPLPPNYKNFAGNACMKYFVISGTHTHLDTEVVTGVRINREIVIACLRLDG